MADEKTTVLITPGQQAAREIAEQRAARRKSGEKANTTRAGGYFLGTDGKPHDSEGRPIVEGKGAKGAPASVEDATADLKAAEEALANARPARAQAVALEQERAASGESATGGEDDDAPTKKKKR